MRSQALVREGAPVRPKDGANVGRFRKVEKLKMEDRLLWFLLQSKNNLRYRVLGHTLGM